MVKRIRESVDHCKQYATDAFRVLESTNLRMLEKGNWEEFTKQPKTCHMQALRQVLTPTGLFNCPAYRGVERAKISDKAAFQDAMTPVYDNYLGENPSLKPLVELIQNTE